VSTRIYKVTNKAGITQGIRAATQAQAIRHAARGEYKAAVASQDDIVSMMSAGVKIEEAGKEQDD